MGQANYVSLTLSETTAALPLYSSTHYFKMRFLVSILIFLFAGVSWAKSAVGDRVLVVLDDESEKALYSQFWADLECRQTLGHDYRPLLTSSDSTEFPSLIRVA